jgi:signal transduction histidine kinase
VGHDQLSLARLSPRRSDGLLALVFVTVGQIDVWRPWGDGFTESGVDGSRPINAVLVLLYTAPLAWRRRAPLGALTVMASALLVQVLFVSPTILFFGALVPIVIITYSVALYGRPRHDLAGLAVILGSLVVIAIGSPGLIDWLFNAVMLSVAWAMGRLVRARQLRADQLGDRAEIAERERDERARVAVAQERGRIAREVHDIVAHSVSVMGVQAGAARVLLDTDVEQARAALLAIERTSREALSEMQHLVEILRKDGESPATTPHPGLSDLDGLLARVRAAGLPVELRIEGERSGLAPGLDLSAYRIVQEALTNTLKHAGPAEATVTLRFGSDDLELLITDTGGGNGAANGGGRGIPGMRERASLYGGELEAGRDSGGYAVHARLPLVAP